MLYFPAEQNVLTSLRAKKVPSPFSLFHSMGHVYLVQLDCLWDYSALVHIYTVEPLFSGLPYYVSNNQSLNDGFSVFFFTLPLSSGHYPFPLG